MGLDALGKGLIDRFDAERPGVLRSLTLLQAVDAESALLSRAAFEAEGGPALDLASAKTLLAAERALGAGLCGHARMVVPCGSRPYWDAGADAATGPEGGLRDARVDAEIGPSSGELERALTA